MKGWLERLRLSWLEILSCLLWCIGGVVLLVFGVLGSYLMLVVSFVFLYADIGYALRLPAASAVVTVLAVVLILYALALVVLGTEDVGGLQVSVPSSIGLLAFASYNLRLVLRRHDRALEENSNAA